MSDCVNDGSFEKSNQSYFFVVVGDPHMFASVYPALMGTSFLMNPESVIIKYAIFDSTPRDPTALVGVPLALVLAYR